MKVSRRRFMIGATTATISVAVAGCSSGDSEEFEGGNGGDNGGDNGNDSSDGSSKDVKLLNHEMVREEEGTPFEEVRVVGEAENVSGGELSYAEVEVKFYEDGTLVNSFLDNISGWSDGEVWAFEVDALEIGEDARAIDSYEIRAGTSL